MPTRIRIPQRIIPGIAVPIEPPRTPRLRHNRIRRDKPPQRGRIVPRVIVIQAEASLVPLRGKAEVGGGGGGVGPTLLPVGVADTDPDLESESSIRVQADASRR